MCKTYSAVNKNVKCKKQFLVKSGPTYYSDVHETNNGNSNGDLPNNSSSNDSGSSPTDVSFKRERSKLAARKRRSQENVNLSDLYLSLPVSPESRLLCHLDNHFIGFFEKTTIIKVSGYVLKLYNSLSDWLTTISFENKKSFPLISVFSQSIFGLFWCNDTLNLVFTCPGLARLTGLYWCNMIGMPRDSLLPEVSNYSEQDKSMIVFLRLMMNVMKDKGIFTVNPQRSIIREEASLKAEMSGINSGSNKDFLAKLPCSVWCSQKLTNGIIFDLIQPMNIKLKALPLTESPFPTNETNYQRIKVKSETCDDIKFSKNQFSSCHATNTLATISVFGDSLSSVGFAEDDFKGSNLFSFFFMDDIFQISEAVNKLISGEKIQVGIARLCTSNSRVYRWCRYIMQISHENDIMVSNISSYRSVAIQGEAYSYNVVNALNAINENDALKLENQQKNSFIQLTYCLSHCFHYETINDDVDNTCHPLNAASNSRSKAEPTVLNNTYNDQKMHSPVNGHHLFHNHFIDEPNSLYNSLHNSSPTTNRPVTRLPDSIDAHYSYFQDFFSPARYCQTNNSILLQELLKPAS